MNLVNKLRNRVTFDKRIRVYFLSVNKNRYLISKYYAHLSTDEKKKADGFKFEIDKERFVISRGVLRVLSGNFLKIKLDEVHFRYGEFGKPSFATNTNLKFNVSHSEDMIVIAFAEDVEIGVDVEFIKTDFDSLKLAESFFSKNEIISLKAQSKEELARAFFRCWTRKESFIKAEGSGLSFPLDKFTVSIDSDLNAELLKTDWDISEKDNWNLFSFTPNTQYIAALAVRKKGMKVEFFDWETLNFPKV